MRAGRLVTLMLLLHRRGRMTAAQLAQELEVSERTVLRDLEELSGAGVPVYATRGPGGGFQLLEGYAPELGGPEDWEPKDRRPGRARRVAVRVEVLAPLELRVEVRRRILSAARFYASDPADPTDAADPVSSVRPVDP